MKELYLLRHAKAKRASGGMQDCHRPLSRRGQRQMAAMAGPLQRLGALDGEIHVSTTTRTRQTLLALDEQLPASSLAGRARYPHELHTFDWKSLRTWITALPPGCDRIILIGHNPALLGLARWLFKQAPTELPTGGLLGLSLPVDSWQELGKHQAERVSRLTPTETSHALFRKQAPRPPDLDQASMDKRVLGLLTHQFRMVRALEPGVTAGFDPEFLHQYRVNLRRSRAIGESVRAIGRVPGLKRVLKHLKQRARATSDLRDLDVFLETLDQQPPSVSEQTLTAVHDWLEHQRRERHAALSHAMAQPAYAHDMARWQRLLSDKVLRRALKAVTPEQVESVLAERILQHDTDLAALADDSPDTSLHELRKAVKRIRYLAELDPRRYRAFLAGLKRRQTLLGEFQDLCTQQAWIRACIEVLSDAGPSGSARKECLGWLDSLEARKAELHRAVMALDPLTETASSP
ncbi:CHAD domain-containing protein [Halomonas rhizosphaerae]|uniref:CHAD domain-containing protein n=1 Tax=Halomonas rhizosphaerae TaxID=3043296 RepID=A0ABT6V1R2_9GAMM|nr:CHAD domain-containing protein [Halomonas rhizosphaerae]MDI5892171.1 CHAD domain-containing protein [Halomonas rhizosphaerae]